jgi:hypothetical protein
VYEGFFSLHPFQHLWLFVFLVTAMLTGVRWNLSAVLIYMSFMAKDVKHFFVYLLIICTSVLVLTFY